MSQNTGVAPICSAPAVPPKFTTPIVRVPAFTVPNIADPQSVLMALLELQIAVMQFTNPPPLNNIPNGPNEFTSTTKSATVQEGDSASQNRNFKEVHRTTKLVKIVNPDDNDQYVIVKQIVGLRFKNKATGQLLTWRLKNPKTSVTELTS